MVGLLLGAVGAVADDRPNFLWIVADDMSPDLGSYGSPDAHTPTLDRLAAEGVRFTRAFATAPVCAPARSTLHTGVHATTLGSHAMRSWAVPPPEVEPLALLLRRAGYWTSNNAKIDWNLTAWRTTPPQSPRPEGGDRMRAVMEPPVGVWDESGFDAHWRHRPDPEQPFFAVFDLFVTHEGRIRLDDDAFGELIAELPASARHDPERVEVPPYYPDTAVVRRDLARYHDLVSVADREVARILDELEADGRAHDTVVFFFSDHGRGLPRAKRWLWDAGLWVPLIVRWPEALAPAVDEELVSFVDFAPTVLDLAGVERPDHLQGRVFLGPRREPEPRFVFATRDRMDESWDRVRAVRGRNFKYLRNFAPELPWTQPIAYLEEMPTMQEWRRLAAAGELEGAAALFLRDRKPAEELYDLSADPHELHDLADSPEHRERLLEMRSALEDWMTRTGDLGAFAESELIERRRPPHRGWTTAPVEAEIESLGEGRRRVTLRCATAGAVIELTTEEGPDARWQLYRGPFDTEARRLRARAGRLGYLPTDEVSWSWEEEGSP